MRWTEVDGVTRVDGAALLPPDPSSVIEALSGLIELSREEPLSVDHYARWARASMGLGRARALGLVGLVTRTGVARLRPDGTLDVHPGVHLQDLAARVGAWAEVREVLSEQAEARDRWLQELSRLARAHPRALARETADEAAARAWLSGAPPSFELRPDERPLPPITHKLRRILEALDHALVERGPQARAVLLALLAGQHALLLGPPGTAKSLLARSLCQVFDGASYFEYLLSRFTHPDELFGPVSIPGLKNEDYRRLTQGFLPRAHVAFLDEIFKANSAILNSLLTLVNERVFHHGQHRDPVPLLGLIGASNELPEAGAGLEALFDRFLVRVMVPPVSQAEGFLKVAVGRVGQVDLDPPDRLTLDEVRELRDQASRVLVPDRVASALVALWERGQRGEWQVSDRRWRQAVHLLRVAAASEGRAQVGPVDLLLLTNCLSADPERSGEIQESVLDVIEAGGPGVSGPRWVELSLAPHESLQAQWALLAADRVAPTRDDPVPLGDPPSGWRPRLALRQRSVARLRAHHAVGVASLTAARERAMSEHGDRLWIRELPTQIVLPYLRAAKAMARILQAVESYAARLSTPEALARDLIGLLPLEERLRAEHLDAVFTIGEIGSIGLAYRQWRQLPSVAPSSACTLELRVEDWLDLIAQERAWAPLLAGLSTKQRRVVDAALPELSRILGTTVIPHPDPVRALT
ncbi:MAG: AAA family ATPase [Deltaproteobacteria bacterium]|nr:MAG: AAA family ATPase [Deltaproteobacteria bacterium]